MKPTPLYHGQNLNPAYHLRYTWAGWLSRESDDPFPVKSLDQILDQIKPLWEQDGLRLLESTYSEERILWTFSTKPTVAPVFLAARAKGRLQHALRLAGTPCKFSRKVGVRSVGKNRIQDVENYIAKQVESAAFIDPAFREKLEQFTLQDTSVDLSQPTATNSGRYWYDLHIVLVVEGRFRFTDEKSLATIRDWSLKVARNKKYGLAFLSVMPDHLHLALRADIEQSPQDLVLAFQNNLAYAIGQNMIWRHNYYVGTLGVYDMNAIRLKSGSAF